MDKKLLYKTMAGLRFLSLESRKLICGHLLDLD